MNCIVNIAAKCTVSLRFWDHPEVRRLVKIHEITHKTKVNSRRVRKGILKKWNDMKTAIAHKLAGTLFPLKYDIGSRKGKSYLGVNTQIVENGQIEILGLGLLPLAGSHTGEYIVDQVRKCLGSYNLSMNQISTATSDNGSNMLSASAIILADPQRGRMLEDVEEIQWDDEDDEWEDIYEDGDDYLDREECRDMFLEIFSTMGIARIIRCAAHTVQLGVHESIGKDTDLHKLIKLLNEAAVHWRDYIRKWRLKAKQPKLANDTR